MKVSKLRTWIFMVSAVLTPGFFSGCEYFDFSSNKTPEVQVPDNLYTSENDNYEVVIPDHWKLDTTVPAMDELSAAFSPIIKESPEYPLIRILAYNVKPELSIEDTVIVYGNKKLSKKHPDSTFETNDFYFGKTHGLLVTFEEGKRRFLQYNFKFGPAYYILSCEVNIDDYPYYKSIFQSFAVSFKKLSGQ
jgi:hypothetical protein